MEEILQWPDLIIMMLTMRIYDDIIVALLVMKPETMRHSTNSWLKIGTSVLARIIRPARQSWAKQIRIPTNKEKAISAVHIDMLFQMPTVERFPYL